MEYDATKYPRRRHTCPECKQPFRFPSHVRRHHAAVHRKQKPNACPVCGAAFALPQHVQRHVRTVHANTTAGGRERWPCARCSCVFGTRDHLRRHSWNQHDAPWVSRRQRRRRQRRRKQCEEWVAQAVVSGLTACRVLRREFPVHVTPRYIPRVDFVLARDAIWFLLEVDERQHARHRLEDEQERMERVSQRLLGGSALQQQQRQQQQSPRALVWIRFNPHGMTATTADAALQALRDVLEHHVPTSPVEVVYLLYRQERQRQFLCGRSTVLTRSRAIVV